ncbi:MAG: metallophosphoesterase family protein, partial [Halanaerobiales bacterium]
EIRDIHYWALGHIHKNNILYSDINKAVAYSGNPQGRHMGEDGVKGFYLVELNSNRSPEIEFIPTSSIIYQQIEIPIDSIRDGNITDLQNLITDISKELLRNRFYLDTRGNINIKGYVVEWVLIGRGIIYDIFKEQEDEIIPHLIAQLRQELIDFTPFIWTKSIINRTSPLINEKELYNSIVFQDINKITDLLKEKETLRDELLKELGLIWTSSLDHEEIDYFKFSLDDETLKTILELSRQYIIEELIERRKLS